MVKTLFFLCYIQTLFGFVLDFGLDVKREGNAPINGLQIYSERCSGSTYLNRLLLANFSFEKNQNFGPKHFSPWFSLPIGHYCGPHHHYTLEGNEETLFIVIFRDPYDWLRSFHRNPWHASGRLWGRPFGEFIRSAWEVDDPELKKTISPLIDRDPKTKQLFKNVIKLRTAKIYNMMMVKDLVNNIYYINYEVLREYPEEVINEIAKIFGLTPKIPFTNIIRYKGNQQKKIYNKKTYRRIRKKDLRYINEQLDHGLEESIGYRII